MRVGDAPVVGRRRVRKRGSARAYVHSAFEARKARDFDALNTLSGGSRGSEVLKLTPIPPILP
jgi:hypothetical protein